MKKPDTLEIIVDTCSLGSDVMDLVGALKEQLKASNRRPYENFIFTIPIQIGTEVKQRIFTEYFYDELAHLRRDGKTDKSIVKLDDLSASEPQARLNPIETNASWAYKLLFAYKALSAMTSEQGATLAPKLQNIGQLLQQRFQNPAATSMEAFTPQEMQSLLAEVTNAFEHFEQRCDEAMIRLRHQHPHFKNMDIDAPMGGQGDSLGEQIIRAEIREIMADECKRIFDVPNDPHCQARRFLIQSLFSTPEVRKAVSDNEKTAAASDKRVQALPLSRFAFNLGDHSIVEAVYDHEHEAGTSPDCTMVISSDKGAKDWVNGLGLLRKDRPVFAMGGYGLATVVSNLCGNGAELAFADEATQARQQHAERMKASTSHGLNADQMREEKTTALHCCRFLKQGKAEGYAPWRK